jgi:hypothetical protein
MNKKAIVLTSLLVLLIHTTGAQPASAQRCESFAQTLTDVWKKWGETIIKVGCVVKAAATTSAAAPLTGGASVAATITLSSTCIKNASKYKEAAEAMVVLFNFLADNGQATLGPRRIEFGNNQFGTLVGPSNRTFVSVYPMDKNSMTFKVKKLEFDGKVEVVICKIDGTNKLTNLAVFNFTGDEKDGTEIVKTVSGVENHLVQIRLNGQSAAKRFKFQFSASK